MRCAVSGEPHAALPQHRLSVMARHVGTLRWASSAMAWGKLDLDWVQRGATKLIKK